MVKSPLTLLSSLLEDVRRFDPRTQGLERDYQTLEARFEHEGIGFITVALGTYADHFDRWLAMRQVAPIPGFATDPGRPLPKFLQGLVSRVFDSSTGLLLEDPDVSALKSVRQILRLFKKALIAENADSLHLKAVASYKKVEEAMPLVPQHLLGRLRWIGTYLLPGLDDSLDRVFECARHGPGAVMEKLTPNGKWEKLVEQIEFDPFPESAYDLNFVEPFSEFSSLRSLPEERSRFASVPKGVTSRRGITVEPVMKQFYQQGLNTVLREGIERCPLLSQCLDLTNQSLSQQLALEGSHNGKWATLDLSSASDLLQLTLVEALFSSSPRFLAMAKQVRSLSEEGNPLLKFAGMGNALTFPIQSVVFAAIACMAHFEDGESFSRGKVKHFFRNIRVYGDDIIVRTDVASRVASLLVLAGLKINPNKSFWEGNFREACGVDAFRGVAVQPIYYRRDPRLTSVSDADLEQLVSTSNQLWMEGYYTLSDQIRRNVERAWGRIPHVPRHGPCIGWHTRSRIVLPTRWDPKLQRPVIKGPVAAPKVRKDPLDGYPALFKFFLTPLKGRGAKHLKETSQRNSNQVRWRWVPVIPVTSTYEV